MPYAVPTDAAVLPSRPTHRRSRSATAFSDEKGDGAFVSLGVLPRRRQPKAVFHLPQDDPDQDDDQPEPVPAPSGSMYAPLNSLRFSMESGRFSPSMSPPTRIDIPPYAPASVPFPTSSPLSPPVDAASPFMPPSPVSMRRNSLPRSPSSSVILSNGKPLKSSLKSSLSSPNIADMRTNTKHLRAQSAPSTPSMHKNVHFAEEGGLASVRLFNRSGKPASVGRPSGDDTETETEAESAYPFPASAASKATASFVHEVDPSPDRTSAIPTAYPSPHANVHLESLTLPRTRPPTMRGTVIVRNISFEKQIAVRFTLDDWQTTSEVMCHHVVSLPGLPPPFPKTTTTGDLAGHIASASVGQDADEPTWDRFSFSIRLEDFEAKLAERTLFLVVRYNPGCGGEFWDNNGGANYRIGFRRATPSPVPSPSSSSISLAVPTTVTTFHSALGQIGSGLGALSLSASAHAQQRTFSPPSTLRTTPTTAAAMFPVAAVQSLRAPQLTRTSSAPLPRPASPPRPQKQPPSPAAAYVARRLSLSNYVSPASTSPTAGPSSMVTPPITPPGSLRLRGADLPLSSAVTEQDATPTQENGPAIKGTVVERPQVLVAGMPATTFDLPFSPTRTASPLLLGQMRAQLLSPPQSTISSPSGSGAASPVRTPSPQSSGLGLTFANAGGSGASTESAAASGNSSESADADASLVGHGNTLEGFDYAASGLGGLGSFGADDGARVDTNDSSYAAFVRQWCFAQSGTPEPPSVRSSPGPSGRVGAWDEKNTNQWLGVGAGAYGHGRGAVGGFGMGLADAGMVGAHMR